MNIDPKLKSFMEKCFQFIKSAKPALYRELESMFISVGPSTNPAFGCESGVYNPVFVGDANLRGAPIGVNAAMDAVFKKDPSKVAMRYRYNQATRKYDVEVRPHAADSVDLVGGQLLSPNGASWFAKPFSEPLSWSIAEELVSMEPGFDPWATVMNLALSSYGGGFAMLSGAGAPNNTMSQDVDVMTGLMVSQIINLAVTYSLTVEELERSKSGSSAPFAGQLISQKQRYAKWVMEFMTAALIYYGNSPTDTKGLLTVNGVTSFSGTTLAAINAGAGTYKGQLAYEQLATLVNTFLTASQNKLTKVDITMSPLALNLFCSMNYSQVYNPQTAAKIFEDNFAAGLGKGGKKVAFNFRSDPLLNPSTDNPFNSVAHDYLILSSPDIATGVDEEVEPVILAAMPLKDFVFPVTPGQYGQQFKTLRRYGGVFAPYSPAIKAYSGWGS